MRTVTGWCLRSRFCSCGGGLFGVDLRLANDCAVLELADRLVGAGNDLLTLLQSAQDLEVLLAGDTHFYGPEGHFVVFPDDKDTLDVLFADILFRLGLSKAGRRVAGRNRFILADRQRDDR